MASPSQDKHAKLKSERENQMQIKKTVSKPVIDDRIYFIRHDHHYFVKRLQKHGDLTLILSDNRDDPQWRKPLLVKDSDDFEVLGRVRWIGSWED